jgi:hypothetical protein
MKKVFLLLIMAIFLLSSCGTPKYSSKLKADVIGFSDDVQLSYKKGSKPYDLLSKEQLDMMRKKVRTLESGSNTAAYYALDLGLDRITEVKDKFMEKDPNSKYYIVILTDGLDNISAQLAKQNNRGKYSSIDDYAESLQKRMNSIMKNKTNVFQSYVLLYKGADLKLSNYSDEELEQKLSTFTGAQNALPPEVLLDEDLDVLLNKFEKTFIITSFDFEIPKGYAGKRIRMALNAKNSSEEKIYFEADFNKHKKDSYKLENITPSDGFTVELPKGGIIYMNNTPNDKSTNAHFSINKLNTRNGPYRVIEKNVEQWFYDMGKLRINSEYDSNSKNTKNAYILVILDTSNSFKDKIDEAKLGIGKIVNIIGGL